MRDGSSNRHRPASRSSATPTGDPCVKIFHSKLACKYDDAAESLVTDNAGNGTARAALGELLCVERSLRLAAERRTLEERERGSRAVIIIEANYGARLLHSILLETLAALSFSISRSSRAGEYKSLPSSSSVSCGKTSFSLSTVAAGAHDNSTNNNNSRKAAEAYMHLLEENRRLRDEVERYKSIDTEERREFNELYRNMQATIDRLIHERDAMHAELTSGSRPWRNSASRGMHESDRIVPTTTTQRSSWQQTHLVDPFALNTEETTESAHRVRVLPL